MMIKRKDVTRQLDFVIKVRELRFALDRERSLIDKLRASSSEQARKESLVMTKEVFITGQNFLWLS